MQDEFGPEEFLLDEDEEEETGTEGEPSEDDLEGDDDDDLTGFGEDPEE